MGWLDGQVALVTGGGSGIGRAVVTRFIEEGARVGVVDRVAARMEQLRTDLGQSVVTMAGDVTQLDDNKRAVADTVKAFGRLDIFVGNAGVFDRFVPLLEFPEDRLSAACDELFAVNVKGCILGAKAALPELMKTAGCMVFTASVASVNSGGGGVAVYRLEARGRRPDPATGSGGGATDTGERRSAGGDENRLARAGALDQHERSHFEDSGSEERLRAGNPLRIALEPDDLAGAYVFLASRAHARGITGTIVTVDAGLTLRMPRRN